MTSILELVKTTFKTTFTQGGADHKNSQGLAVSFFKTSDNISFKDVIPESVEGTCEWFYNHTRYSEWLNSDGDDLLLLSADPGCGKSVLSRTVVDRTLASETSVTVLYFFFQDNAQQDGASLAICALLHQLFSRNGELFRIHVVPAYELHGNSLTSDFEALWDLFLNTARDPRVGNIVCILDALDECQKEARYQIIRKLQNFYRSLSRNLQPTNKGIMKIFVTSRPYQDILSGFDGTTSLLPSIRLAGKDESEAIGKDIEMVIRARVREIGKNRKLRMETQRKALSMLLETKDWTYLWLKSVFEEVSVRSPGTPGQWNAVITQLPLSVEDAYEKILSRSTDRDRARKILQIVVAAQKPLTVSEMDVALSIEDNSTSYDALQLGGDDYTSAYIRDVCGLFLRIVGSKSTSFTQQQKASLLDSLKIAVKGGKTPSYLLNVILSWLAFV